MTTATNASYALTSRYATALIELAESAGKIEKIERDLNDLSSMIAASPDLALLVRSQSFSRKTQVEAMLAVATKADFDKLTQNFLGVLVQNRRLGAVSSIIRDVKAELAKRRGEVTAKIETAQDLTPAQLKSLQEILTKNTGRKVSIQAKVEPALMGGMIVTVGSMMIDDSVRHKLEKLRGAMMKQANENLKKTA